MKGPAGALPVAAGMSPAPEFSGTLLAVFSESSLPVVPGLGAEGSLELPSSGFVAAGCASGEVGAAPPKGGTSPDGEVPSAAVLHD